MLLLGLLLLGATGAFAGLLIAYNSSGGPDYTVTMFSNNLGTLTSLQIFLSGIALALLFCLALAMTAGGARSLRRRGAAQRATRDEAAQARAERDALAAKLGDDQSLTDGLITEAPGSSSQTRMRTEDPSAAPTRKRHRMPHVFGH
jgi:hypothetical protein